MPTIKDYRNLQREISTLQAQAKEKDEQIKKLQSELKTMIEMWSRVVKHQNDEPKKPTEQRVKVFGGTTLVK